MDSIPILHCPACGDKQTLKPVGLPEPGDATSLWHCHGCELPWLYDHASKQLRAPRIGERRGSLASPLMSVDAENDEERIVRLDRMLVKLTDVQQMAERRAAESRDRAAQIAHQIRTLAEELRRLKSGASVTE
jgi:hypothetical protein